VAVLLSGNSSRAAPQSMLELIDYVCMIDKDTTLHCFFRALNVFFVVLLRAIHIGGSRWLIHLEPSSSLDLLVYSRLYPLISPGNQNDLALIGLANPAAVPVLLSVLIS
jgi:hypothetical protein